jgi:lipopolysaccharide transport system permease protein
MMHSTTRRHWWGLVWTLVRTDFKARYHGTLGGFVWALLKPLAMFLVLTLVFSLVFRSEPTYKLDLLIGLFLYDFFGETSKTAITALHARGFLLSKAQVPSWILVATTISNPLITVTVFCVAVVTLLSAYGQPPSIAHVLLFLLYVSALGTIAMAVGLAGSVLFLRYRDLNQVWEVVVQAGFFLAPVIYPLGVIPERFHFYMYAWPPTAAIEFSRAVLIQQRPPTLRAHIDLLGLTLAMFAVGLLVHQRLAPRSAEHL